MKKHVLFAILILSSGLFAQKKINYYINATNFNSSIEDNNGTILRFDIYNKDKAIGYGGGWLIYNEGTQKLTALLNNEYKEYSRKGYACIKDIFGVLKEKNIKDSSFLINFDKYIYLVDPKHLLYKKETDSDSDSGYYSYHILHPCYMYLYKENSNTGLFEVIDSVYLRDFNEEVNAKRMMFSLQKKTSMDSNNK